MKKIIILIIASACYCGLKADSISYDFNKHIRKDRAKMYGTISAIMAPSIIFYLSAERSDKVGRTIFASMAGTSAASFIMSINYSQKKKVARNACFLIAGALDGFNQELLFHYPRVKQVLGITNDQWFDPSISWKNKYTSNTPFAKTLLVGTTDAHHASRSLNKIFIMTGIVTLNEKKKIKKQIKQIVVASFLYTFGKGLTHQLLM